MLPALRRAFTPYPPYPPEHRRNFILLFLDVAFFGILNGSTIAFLGVYASRVGASPAEVGILTASPALMNILLSFPASNFARGKSNYLVTRWAWLATRLFFALLIPIPLLLAPAIQVWVIIALTLAMNIPGTVAAVIGNAFFAETVPIQFRGSVVGTRNALLAASSMLASLTIGQISKMLPLAEQYTAVFTIGFIGGILSCAMLFLVRPVVDATGNSLPEPPQPSRKGRLSSMRPEILRGPFGRIVLIVFIFHLAVFWANPIFPLYQTRGLEFSDLTISQGTSLFWVIYFLSSTQSGALARRWGFRKLLGFGTCGVGVSLLIITFSYQPWIYMCGQVVNGIAWAWIGGGLINYVLENVPANDRPAHLAWNNTAVNGAMLICGLVVPLTLDLTGLTGGMILATALRFAAAAIVLLWGEKGSQRSHAA